MTQPVWGQPQPPARRGLPVPVIIILAVVGVGALLCVVGAVAAVVAGDGDNARDASATSTSSPRQGLDAATTPSGTSPATTAPPASSAPATAVMPNLVGKNAAVADDELEKLGFSKVQFGSQDPDDKVVILPANWTVTKQSHKAGTALPTDTLIVLTCTKG